MDEIQINGRMTVSSLKEAFKTQTGGTLRVKYGAKRATTVPLSLPSVKARAMAA